MPKAKISDFKKYIAEFSHEELKDEMLRLFQKLEQVQAFYAQELLSPDDRKKILEDYKKKLYKEFWTSYGNPKMSNNKSKKAIITEFEKVCVAQSELVELLLYRVDLTMDQANQFGGLSEAEYNTALTAFEKAVKIVAKEKLEKYLLEDCRHVARNRGNMDWWPVRQMEFWLEQYFGDYEEE